MVDTRFVASRPGGRFGGVRGLNLGGLNGVVVAAGQQELGGSGVGVVVEEGFDVCAGSRGAHDAGFDSWMTAVVFLGMGREVGLRGVGKKGVGKEMAAPGSGDELFQELSPFGDGSRAGVRSMEEPSLQWECEVWRRYGNKLRLGGVGVMDLAEE